ncbi:MAG: hypothetical protein AAB901_00965, partial [Patescibacteria group bacterium]
VGELSEGALQVKALAFRFKNESQDGHSPSIPGTDSNRKSRLFVQSLLDLSGETKGFVLNEEMRRLTREFFGKTLIDETLRNPEAHPIIYGLLHAEYVSVHTT